MTIPRHKFYVGEEVTVRSNGALLYIARITDHHAAVDTDSTLFYRVQIIRRLLEAGRAAYHPGEYRTSTEDELSLLSSDLMPTLLAQ